MRLRIATIIAMFGLAGSLALCPAASGEEQRLQATVGAVAEAFSVSGNKAKFHEYSDKTSGGVFADVNATYDTEAYFLGFLATDPGYDTQHYRLEAGPYGKFTYFFDYNEIIHNITPHARSFYSGVGTGNLVGAPGTDPTAWPAAFDYFTKRKKIDTGLRIPIVKPFFFNVSYSHEDKDGLRPVGVATAGVGAASLELPAPIDYSTNGIAAEGGYAKNPFFVSFSYFYNEMKNGVDDITFLNPASGAADILSRPPDNKFYRFNLKGSAKLPVNSKFSTNLGQARTTSDAPIFTSFDGKVDTRDADFVLSSNPLQFLEGKVYYKYHERDNRSTGSIPVNALLTTTNPLFYQTNTYGADIGLRLPAKFFLDTGYKRVETDRRIRFETDPTVVLPFNRDNVYFVDLRYKGLEWLEAKVGYERLDRNADYRTPQSRALINRQFAYASQDRDTFKAGVDLSLIENLNFGAEYRYKKTDYRNTAIGFTDDTRNAVSFNADYAYAKLARFYGYFDYETATLNQNGIVTASPWQSKQEENTYGYGLRADVYVIPKKLTFIVQGDYLRANGSNDFDFFDTAIWGAILVPTGSPVDIPNWDDYQKYSARFTAVYDWKESVTLRAGYAYERYKYSDAQLAGYQLIASGAASNQAFLTGAYSSPSYRAHIVFLGATYRFK